MNFIRRMLTFVKYLSASVRPGFFAVLLLWQHDFDTGCLKEKGFTLVDRSWGDAEMPSISAGRSRWKEPEAAGHITHTVQSRKEQINMCMFILSSITHVLPYMLHTQRMMPALLRLFFLSINIIKKNFYKCAQSPSWCTQSHIEIPIQVILDCARLMIKNNYHFSTPC